MVSDAPWRPSAQQLRAEFPELVEVINEADKQALAELAALNAERVDLQARVRALQQQLDNLRKRRK